MSNGGIYPLAPMASYHHTGQRSDSGIKVESPENLSGHAQYNTPSPGKHSGLEPEQPYSHSVSSMGITSNDPPGALGTVSVGAS